jgi:actin-related protein 8
MLHTTSSRGPQPVLEDIHKIWATAFEKHLGISRTDLPNYKILIVIPDLFHRVTVQHYFDVALRMMGFCAAMCHVESVCTAFGAGLQSCCVVNVGDRCTSIACVEDGVSINSTRLELAYGGRDVQDTLLRFLRCIDFPFVAATVLRPLSGSLFMNPPPPCPALTHACTLHDFQLCRM